MRVVLKPTSHPRLGEIVIEECLFPIGRQEAPFASYGNGVVAKLSRRHARIFQEGGAVYLVDLGSLNGTRLNGHSVQKKPVRLHDGDAIALADEISYTVQIAGEADVPGAALPLRLTLLPRDGGGGIEPIVVARFPFLVGKNAEAFRLYQERFPEQLRHISRRHALVFLKDNEVYVEDLGSTNGTFVAGVRLDEHAVPLRDGDAIAFGGEHFAYTAQVEREETKAVGPAAQAPSARHDKVQGAVGEEPRTTFLATADSFLDIFCQQDEGKEEREPASPRAGEAVGLLPAPVDERQLPARARLGPLSKAGVFLTELKTALGGGERAASSRRLWLLGGVGALILAVSAVLYFRGAPERELRDLLAKGQYAEGAALADRYLARRPGDEALGALATEAMLKHVVPDWTERLQQGDFAGAERALAGARDFSQANREGLAMLELMGWMGELEAFVAGRGGPAAPIVIFEHEADMEALIERWDSDATGRRRLLVRILGYVPAFQEPYARAFSHLTMLQSEKSSYLKAIAELKQTLQDKLAADQPEALAAVFASFQNKYPKIQGVERLQADLQGYLALRRAVREQDLSEVLRLRRELEFQVPPFRAQAAALLEGLPSAEVVDEYQRASQAWLAGDSAQAMAILQPLTQQAWGEVAARRLSHYGEVVEAFEALRTARAAEDDGERVLLFYAMLDPDEDAFFLRSIEADFQVQKGRALEEAEEAFRLAQLRWSAYRDGAGIGGLLRVQAVVSDTFRQQAQRLSEAHRQVVRGARVYDILRIEYPSAWKPLHEEILAEVKRQRQWLTDLSMVLEPSLLRAKLQLLPELPEEAP